MAKINIAPPVLTMEKLEWFWDRINRAEGQGPKGDCWEWQAHRGPKGYGVLTDTNRRHIATHRVSYLLFTGIWSANLICHHCDNPPCCNPQHLFEGTNGDNIRDRNKKGRANVAKGEDRSSIFTNQDIRDIRNMYVPRKVTQKFIADIYGVRESTIHKIVRRQRWQHVP